VGEAEEGRTAASGNLLKQPAGGECGEKPPVNRG
jgi:hypothetical protein